MTGATTAFGRYRILAEAGRGAHSTVHVAEDAKLGRRVALKIFTAGPGSEGADAEKRYRREVMALSRLDVPGVCRLFDAGKEEGSHYIAMTHVAGRTLAEIIGADSGRHRRTELVGAIESAARTLELVHRAGVVHGDVKPGNLLIGEDGVCSILDFSLARTHDAKEGDVPAGGTLPYMAPEHFTGEIAGAAADVYALGATLHEVLTGRAPFVAPTQAGLVAAIVENDFGEIREKRHGVNRDLVAITEWCLERNPARRYPSALDLAEDLSRFRRGEPVRARRLGPFGRALKLARRHLAASYLALFLVLALASWLWGVEASRIEEERLLEAASSQSVLAHARSAQASEHLTRFLRLSDVQKLADLQRRSALLWPPRPEIAPELMRLLDDARALAARRTEHEATLASLRAGGGASASAASSVRDAALLREIHDLERRDHPAARACAAKLRERVTSAIAHEYDDAAKSFEDQVLARLVAGLAELRGSDPDTALIATAERRLEAARALATTTEGHAAEWERAAASIASTRECPFYGGLRLQPQAGLVPLGRDPASGLWEFHHPATGGRPDREASGGWRVDEGTGLVMVLVPGGTATLGARRPPPGSRADAPFVDPDADSNELPVHQLELSPFFISKYEMTKGQWLRAELRDPAAVVLPPDAHGLTVTLVHPVSALTWREAALAMWRLGLVLPTEAQWEYAARAGTSTPWWTGAGAATLAGCANCGDRSYFAAFPPGARPEGADLVDDGWSTSAPVGIFRANAFGLHDVHGNMAEWCRDAYAHYDVLFQEKDGELLGVATAERVFRGGMYSTPFAFTRSAKRAHIPPDRRQGVGVRPARAVD